MHGLDRVRGADDRVASRPASRHLASAASHCPRAASRPESPGAGGQQQRDVDGPRSARALSAASRSSEVAVTLAITRTWAWLGHGPNRTPRNGGAPSFSERQLDDLGGRRRPADRDRVAGAASRRTMASAIGPSRGETTTSPSRPTTFSPSLSSAPDGARLAEPQPRRWRLGLPR